MRVYFVALFFLSSTYISAQTVQKLIRQGNSAYDSKKYKEAEIANRKALVKSPDNEKAAFNLGNALYKQQQYDESSAVYKKMLESKKLKEVSESGLYYNMGNSFLQNKDYAKSIDAYKNALRLNPKDESARYNLQYALNKLQQQQQKQQQQQQKQQQQQQPQQNPQTPPPPHTNLSKQDADRMLNAVNNNEKRTLSKTQKQPPNLQYSQPEKDW